MALEPKPMPSPTLRFDFDDDTPWPGHSVICRRNVALEAAVALEALAASPEASEQLAGARRFAELFVVDWTFSETGDDGAIRKLPVTGDVFVRVLDARMAMELFQRWLEALGTRVSDPLVPLSEPGAPEPEPEPVRIPARTGP